jgi:hypothetical protein
VTSPLCTSTASGQLSTSRTSDLNRESARLLEADESRIAPPAVLRRSEGTGFSSRSHNEEGWRQRRDPRRASLPSEAIKIARSAPSELAERGNPIGSRAAVLDEGASTQPPRTFQAVQQHCCVRASEEGSGLTARSAPSELGARANPI